MALALPAVGRRVLRFGLQALRRLGLRPTELNSYLSVSAASVKRYVVARDGGGDPERPPRRRLRREQEEALFLYWWDVIAERKPLAPVAPGRRLLDAFCPTCLHVPAPATTRRPDLAEETGPHTLEEALSIGTQCCEAGVRPCVQGPARLAALVTWLDVDARAAAAYLERLRPDPRGLWVRTCLYCDAIMVVDDAAGDRIRRLCPRHANRSA
jgi:hypothetical protein